MAFFETFYLKVYKPEEFQLVWKPIGGDGAPFGKYGQSCAWLVSVLNVGKRFLSNEDNFSDIQSQLL